MDVFDLTAKIALDTSEYEDKLGKAKSNTTSYVNSVNKGMKTAGKIGIAVLGTIIAGTAAIGTKAMESFADYEQLTGGIETLFKQSQNTVMQYANNAYRTAGMSANKYMDTVTSFSASLIKSLGGDTQKAAKAADMAITDMSDNANKMGSDMSMIQNAYQGFAKQNYTMLDNLKLGYGGTKTEMQRLLKDAQAISGIKYDISSFADIVSAIHVVQTEMGITGTTAKEASSTIQGSIASMKAAWENFLVGAVDPTQDFDKLIDNLVDSVLTVSKNLFPRLSKMLPKLVSGLFSLIEGLIPYLPEILASLLPALTRSVVGVVTAAIDIIPDLILALGPALLDCVQILVDELVPYIPQMVGTLSPAFTEALIALLLEIIKRTPEILASLGSGLWEGVKSIPKGGYRAPRLSTGLNYVPYDEYPALLHRGEAVLTSTEARRWRSGENTVVGTSGADEIIALLRALLGAVEDGKTIELNGREVGRMVRGYA